MKKTIGALVVSAGVLASSLFGNANVDAATNSYSDLTSKHWAYDNIQKITEKGLMSGFPNGKFNAENSMTRAEFITVLARSIDSDERVSEPFTDVSETFWAKDYIEEAIALGFINPSNYSNNKFEPDKAVTRQEVARWLTDGLTYENAEYGEIRNTIQKSEHTLLPVTEFLKGKINKAYYGDIGVMIGTGLMVGDQNGAFKPSNAITRAEVASVILRYLNVGEPSNYNAINELVEVAKTATNMLSISNYKYSPYLGDLTFDSIVNKSITFGSIGEKKFKRMIFIPSDSKTKAYTSVYGKMFFDENIGTTENSMYLFTEQIYTPNKDKVGIMSYYQASYNSLLSARSVLDDSPIVKQYGYRGIPAREYPDVFKKDVPYLYWTINTSKHQKNADVSYAIRIDQNAAFSFLYSE